MLSACRSLSAEVPVEFGHWLAESKHPRPQGRMMSSPSSTRQVLGSFSSMPLACIFSHWYNLVKCTVVEDVHKETTISENKGKGNSLPRLFNVKLASHQSLTYIIYGVDAISNSLSKLCWRPGFFMQRTHKTLLNTQVQMHELLLPQKHRLRLCSSS